ncbi:MAG TPA: proton-conducting transporter membrane subunit [Dermatophilaceae bacterium]|nr:proton-conducting transporter membrane subunit [Dermatophilaceae bacterium]
MTVSIDLATLLPVLGPAAAAVVVLVLDIALPGRRTVHYLLALLGLVAGGAGTAPGLGLAAGDAARTLCLPDGSCLYAAGALASSLQLAALVAAAAALLVALPSRQQAHGGAAVTVSLALAATAGAVAVAAAVDLGSWLVSLELATLPVIALVALRGTATAVTGAVTLLVTSLVSFALLALAAALWYSATGSALLDTAAVLAVSADPARRSVLVLAVVLVVGGVGFKLSLVPFHAWTPEAYSGAPLPVALFLAGTSKVAALAALLVVIRAVSALGAPVLTAVAVVAAVSMTLGNVVALRQQDAVRLLAWSTVAQAGWVVLPLAAVSSAAAAASGAYLLAYVVATVVAFVVVAVLARASGLRRARELTAYRGLLRTRPLLGVALALALLSLAGLPPGVLGLVAKVAALRPVVADELWLLAVVAAVNAVVGVAVYLRWLLLLVAVPDPAEAVAPRLHVDAPVGVALGLATGLLVVTSISPQLLLGLLGR